MKFFLIEAVKSTGFNIINISRRVVYIICTILFRVDSKKVFINCFDGKGYGDSPKYIYEELCHRRNDLKYVWIYNGNSSIDKQYIESARAFSIKAIYHQATSKIWISTVRLPYYSFKRQEQIYIQTWHGGLRLKKVENECPEALSSRYIRIAKHDSSMIDYYISSNQDNTELYKKFFWYQGGEILNIGSPRNDIFFHNDGKIAEDIKKKMNLMGYKIVTYAPTFRRNGSLEVYSLDYEGLKKSLTNKFGGSWKVLVRLHPRLMEKSLKFIEYSEAVINCSFVPDMQEILLISDVLITDYSSVATDFIHTGRPTFLFATDIEEYVKDRDFHIDLFDLPFMVATNNDELFRNIANFDIVDYYSRVELFKNTYQFYDDGSASSQTADIIEEAVKNSPK